MASGTIKTIQFSTKKADELAKVFPAESTKFLASGWGLTENSPRGGDFSPDLKIVEMEFDENDLVVKGHPTDPERILVANHWNPFNGQKSTGRGDSGGNEIKIEIIMHNNCL